MAVKRREEGKILSFVKNSKLNNIIEKGQFVYDKDIYTVLESLAQGVSMRGYVLSILKMN